MSNLSLGPVVSKLGGGGAEVHAIPVNFVSSSGTGVKHVVDVPIPAGVTAHVVVVGISGVSVTIQGATPDLMIGGVIVAHPVQAFAGERVVTGPTVVEANRRNTVLDPSFVGTVYWWEVSNE